jgi:hypothetical protein
MILKSIKLVFLSLLTAVSACNLTQKSSEENPEIIEGQLLETTLNFTVSSLKSSMEFLASNELRGRETGTEGIEKAALFIEEEFKNAGLKPYYKTYRDSFEVRGKNAYNLVGFLEGTDPELKKEFVILGAHYDHIGLGNVVEGDSIANGANDNAAGTIVVLELAKQLAKYNTNKRSILFVLFSAEEMGLQGSKHLASKLKAEGLNLYTMINFEMVGVPMNRKNYVAYLTGYEDSNLATKFNEYSNDEEILGYLPQAKEFNLFMRSDNYPFYQEFKVPAQTISTFDFTNYNFYHHVSDEADKMDYSHMAKLISKVIPGIYGIVNSAEKEIKMNQQ